MKTIILGLCGLGTHLIVYSSTRYATKLVLVYSTLALHLYNLMMCWKYLREVIKNAYSVNFSFKSIYRPYLEIVCLTAMLACCDSVIAVLIPQFLSMLTSLTDQAI